MVMTGLVWDYWWIILIPVNNEKLVHPTASSLNLDTEFRKVQYWDPYYSIYL